MDLLQKNTRICKISVFLLYKITSPFTPSRDSYHEPWRACKISDVQNIVILGGMEPTVILAIASLHKLHIDHPYFDYERLFQIVDRFQPDHVGVEIRPEDIGADEGYLRHNYPFEMIELSMRYGNDRCFGFDWLGEDIAGQPILVNYWKEISVQKKLERSIAEDPEFQETSLLDDLINQQMDIIKNATPASLIDGKYGTVTKQYYQAMDDLLLGTKYEPLSQFRKKRDQEIGKLMVNFIREHLDSRIALVMGANHHVFALENLSKEFQDGELIFAKPE